MKMIYLIAVASILVGAINSLMIGALQLNIIDRIFGRMGGRVVYVFIGLCALMLMFNRDTYLPFLGETVAPCVGFPDRVPSGATKEVIVHVRPGAKVLYWAAEPAMEGIKEVPDWRKAYSNFDNAGMITADAQGRATLLVRNPQAYTVPGGRLEAHVHYRVCEPHGMMGRVQTKFVSGYMDYGASGSYATA